MINKDFVADSKSIYIFIQFYSGESKSSFEKFVFLHFSILKCRVAYFCYFSITMMIHDIKLKYNIEHKFEYLPTKLQRNRGIEFFYSAQFLL